jgi:hypothetical protein
VGFALLVSIIPRTASVGLCGRVFSARHIRNQVFITDSACLETQKKGNIQTESRSSRSVHLAETD